MVAQLGELARSGADAGPDSASCALARGLLGEEPKAGGGWAWRALGYTSVALVVVTWVAQSEVAQSVEVTDYDRPYIITYINHSSGLLLAPAQGIALMLLGRPQRFPLPSKTSWALVGVHLLLIAFLYQLADWVWYLGLASTTVADGTIIFNSMSVFVFLLEWARRKERMTLRKACAVLAAFAGVACIVELGPGGAEGGDGADLTAGSCLGRSVGNLCVLLAAFLYAVYQVCIDQVVQSQDVVATNLVVSLQGAATLLVLWPGALLLAGLPERWCARERLSWPPAPAVAGLAATCALALSFNVFFCLAIVTTSPLLTSVGCTLTVPASLLADLLLHGDPIQPMALAGSALVLAGFLALALAPAGA